MTLSFDLTQANEALDDTLNPFQRKINRISNLAM